MKESNLSAGELSVLSELKAKFNDKEFANNVASALYVLGQVEDTFGVSIAEFAVSIRKWQRDVDHLAGELGVMAKASSYIGLSNSEFSYEVNNLLCDLDEKVHVSHKAQEAEQLARAAEAIRAMHKDKWLNKNNA